MASCHSVTWGLLTFHLEDGTLYFVGWIFLLPKVPPFGSYTQKVKDSFYHHLVDHDGSEVCSRAAGVVESRGR